MSKAAQFVVIIMDTATWMENQAKKFYSNLFSSEAIGEKYVSETLSISELFKVQNDFNIEVLMVHENEIPSSFLQLNSSRIFNEKIEASKPICINHIVYFNTEEIQVLFNRTEVIAKQRKHDLVWVKLFESDAILKETLLSMNYSFFDFEENATENLPEKQIFLKKEII
ncbi:hypothetical protein [Flavobacterium ginsenosidimutans]|uniref:Uncharacterized protein n=1 Tax=Flavobacterium ginsenosidimutans TaxID=687844 RepID=A0ABZ2Q1I8_9FLAO|nr:hypothetical protein [Flavobacterium ginsenosidimutans]KAF2326517.1 hypothetical protein DM444_21745 [Flavobacterium ginsenosidimutans]